MQSKEDIMSPQVDNQLLQKNSESGSQLLELMQFQGGGKKSRTNGHKNH